MSSQQAESSFDGRAAFALGTGRCGTKFLAEVMALEKNVASVHERNPLNETFHRYKKWYGLPVDDQGFLYQKEKEIMNDLDRAAFSFESSAFLSLSINELYERFRAKFILLVRQPERVVNSYLKKGYYLEKAVQADPNLALGYQPCDNFHHFLGRVMPRGDEFLEWNEMSRVGKIAWFWNAINQAVLDQFETLPPSHSMVVRLEEFDYDAYRRFTDFLAIESTVARDKYERLTRKRPNAIRNVPTTESWTDTEFEEFRREVSPVAKMLEYALP